MPTFTFIFRLCLLYLYYVPILDERKSMSNMTPNCQTWRATLLFAWFYPFNQEKFLVGNFRVCSQKRKKMRCHNWLQRSLCFYKTHKEKKSCEKCNFAKEILQVKCHKFLLNFMPFIPTIIRSGLTITISITYNRNYFIIYFTNS